MRLLHIADIHLGHPFRWLGPERGRRRRQELRDSLTRVLDLAREHRVDALCIAGDLFEIENTPPSVGEALRATFASYPDVPILIAPGDSDPLRDGCLYDTVSWSTNVQIFRGANPTPLAIGDGKVWGCAFRAAQRQSSPLAGLRIAEKGVHVGLFHADVVEEGGTSNYGPLVPFSIAASGLRFALLGHRHAGRIEREKGFAYPGSLEPLDVSEVGPRWALLYDVSPSEVNVEPLEVARRQVRREQLDVSDVSTREDLRRRVAERAADWRDVDLDLTVVGQLHGDLLDPDVIGEALKSYDVVLTVEARPDEELRRLAAQPTTRGAFVRMVLDRLQSDPAEDRERWEDVLHTGLAAFRGEEVTLT